MATKDDDIEIIIEEDAPVKVEEVTGAEKAPLNLRQGQEEPATVEKKSKVITPEEGIEQLKANLEQSKRDKEAADRRAAESERRAREAAQAAGSAAKEVRDTNISLVTNAIETIKMSQGALKTNLAAAMAAGDFNEAAEIQLKMSDNSAKLTQLESGKAEMEIAAKRPDPAPVQRSDDPVEHVAAQLSPQSAAWIRSHPEFARSPENYQKVVRADAKVWGNGIERDTPEYFEHVERELGLRGDGGGREPSRGRESPPAAAPPSRPGNSDGSGGGRQTIRLTRDEIEMAELNGMSPQEYAKNKAALKAEGRLN